MGLQGKFNGIEFGFNGIEALGGYPCTHTRRENSMKAPMIHVVSLVPARKGK